MAAITVPRSLRLSLPLALVLAASLSPPASARPDFPNLVPNGNAHARPDSGIDCEHLGHTPCDVQNKQTVNVFGNAFKEAEYVWTKELCMADADGDGLSNGHELGDPCCQWTDAADDSLLRLTGLSHPGVADDRTDVDMPQCGTPSASPSSAALPSRSPLATPSSSAAPVKTPTPSSSVSTAPSKDGMPSPTPSLVPGTNASTAPLPTASPSVTGTTAPTANVTLTPTPTSNETDDEVCFPSHARVALRDGRTVAMSHLSVGDVVQVGRNAYSPIFMFTHRDNHLVSRFVTLRATRLSRPAATVTLSLTPGHHLYVNGQLQPASRAATGDILTLGDNARAVVMSVSHESLRGLYNPQTLHGDIVVDGVTTSTYTTAVKPQAAHSLLAPLRLVFRYTGWSTKSLDHGASPRLVSWLP